MQIETVGQYQLHFIAHELPGGGTWDPFVSIFKFDEVADDFRCVLEKHHVEGAPYDSYEAAIEAARRAGNHFLNAGNL